MGAEHYEIVICHYSRNSPEKLSVTVYKSVSKDHTTRSFIFQDYYKGWISADRVFAYDDGVFYLPKLYHDFNEPDIRILRLNMKNGDMNEITVVPCAYPSYTEPSVLL